MNDKAHEKDWVFIFVNNPGKNEEFSGFYDQELQIRFIPAFNAKEDAQFCSGRFMDRLADFEVQAVHKDDLNRYAEEHHFLIFMLDRTGAILEKIAPMEASSQDG